MLPRAGAARWLSVAEGRVWLTTMSPAGADEPPADIWLAAGEGLCLPAGTAWVLEGWPRARVNVLLAPPRDD